MNVEETTEWLTLDLLVAVLCLLVLTEMSGVEIDGSRASNKECTQVIVSHLFRVLVSFPIELLANPESCAQKVC